MFACQRQWSLAAFLLCSLPACGAEPAAKTKMKPESDYPEITTRLTPLAAKLPTPGPSDWLANHKEKGQTFNQYFAAQQYLGILYDSPVKVRKTIALADLPPRAQRKHPTIGNHQILSTFVLSDVLAADRPQDALAYLAFTATDLYPQDDWNFVFGQASLRERTGVWSIYRNGDPAKSDEAFRVCLRRTLKTAGHETGHILTIQHCIAFHCGMNGSNHLEEADGQPLAFCPVCYRKLCWNLQVEPREHLQKLAKFCTEHKLSDEAEFFTKQSQALK